MDTLVPKDYVELISILVVLIIGIFNIAITIIQHKKSSFINSVSQARFKYISDLRRSISNFCALAIDSKNINIEDVLKAKYHILLSLDPECEEWDKKIIDMIEEITSQIIIDNKDKERIKDLVLFSQFLFKLEWAGVQLEAKKGILSPDAKQGLRTQILAKYNQFKTK